MGHFKASSAVLPLSQVQPYRRDIYYYAHIYNITVNADILQNLLTFQEIKLFHLSILKAIKAEPKEYRHEYDYKQDKASNPEDMFVLSERSKSRSGLFKGRFIAHLFYNRRLPRTELKKQCKVANLKYKRIPMDIPIHWNLTDKIVVEILHQEVSIRTVLVVQKMG
jgi:hypothetical protein